MKLPLRRSGFTLIELLIVVAIIGILAALVSSAIMKLTKTAASKRNVNNAERLEAAIVEYWHDMGRWPLPKNAKPKIKKGTGKALDGSADTTVDTYSYTMSFTGDNNKVVENLLDATLPDGTPKTFLDLHGFSTPTDTSATSGPYENVVDAWLAYNGEALTPDGSTFTQKKPTLVYFAPFLECPKCHTFYAATGSRTFCEDSQCQKDNGGKKYRFTRAQKAHPVSKAMPFVVEFDLFSNVVKVRAP
jgi:prepilin-type N-terminal cleavage/methylation domain-containing protein